MDRLAQRNKARKLAAWLKAREELGPRRAEARDAAAAKRAAKKEANRRAQLDFIGMAKFVDLVVQRKRLNANDNEPKGTFNSAHNFYEALKKKGFEYLGSGAYSRVVAKKDSDRVIKICTYAQGDGWVDYVLWANQKGYGGTFAPKIYSYKWIKTEKGGFGVAVMERMKHTVSREDRKSSAKLIPNLFEYSLYDNDNAKAVADLLAPGMGAFIDDFRNKFGGDGNFDLHNGNFMVREDGSFCVSDPLAGTSSTVYNTRFRRAA